MAHFPLGGPVLTLDAAKSRGWSHEGNSLVRQVLCRDSAEAVRLADELADRAVDWNRRADVTTRSAWLRVVVANRHHAGITLAELRLATKVTAILDELPVDTSVHLR
jgi:pterin-4a-carbinolamine dehydratase